MVRFDSGTEFKDCGIGGVVLRLFAVTLLCGVLDGGSGGVARADACRLHEDSFCLRLRRWLCLGCGLLGRGLLFFRLRSCGVGREQRNQNCAHDDASLSAPLHDMPLDLGIPLHPLLAFCSTVAGESSCAVLPLFLVPEQLDGHSAIRLSIEISEPPLAPRTFPAATLRDGSAFCPEGLDLSVN